MNPRYRIFLEIDLTAVVHKIIISTLNPFLYLYRPYSTTRFRHSHCCTSVRFQEEGVAAVSWCLACRYYSSVMVSAVGQCQSLLAPNCCGCLCERVCCSHLHSNVPFRQQGSTTHAETDSVRVMKSPSPRSLVNQMESSSSMQAIHRPEVSASKSQTSIDINSLHLSDVGVMYYFI